MRIQIILFFFLSFLSFSQSSNGILTANVNVRWGPGTNHKIIKQLPRGKQVNILENKGNWSLILDPNNNKKGWISKKYISVNSNYKIGSLKSDVNVRWGPGTNHKIIKQLPRGKQVNILENKGNWSLILDPNNNKKGWVSTSYILTGKLSNYAELIANSNIRYGPGTNHNIIKQLPRGKKISIIKTDGNWFYFIDPENNKTGWVSKSLVKSNVNFDLTNSNNTINTTNPYGVNTKVLNNWRWKTFLNEYPAKNKLKINPNDIDKLISVAKSYIGTPYSWGGITKSGIDCSGLIYKSLRAIGYTDSKKNANTLAQSGTIIPNKKALRKGDFVCLHRTTSSNNFITHIGIYIGDGNFIHSSSSRGVVINNISESYYSKHWAFGVRIIK